MDERIRQVLAQHGRLAVDVASVTPTADLYRSGLTSHASVNVMIGLEDEFDVEFPDRMLKKATFESIESIAAALGELGVDAVA